MGSKTAPRNSGFDLFDTVIKFKGLTKPNSFTKRNGNKQWAYDLCLHLVTLARVPEEGNFNYFIQVLHKVAPAFVATMHKIRKEKNFRMPEIDEIKIIVKRSA